MEYLQEINLELNSNTAYTTVGAKQGDSGSRVIKIHITEDGEDWIIPAGTTASYRVRKPDGHAVWDDAVVDFTDNVIYVTLSAQTLAAAGRAYADVMLMSGEEGSYQVLSTVSFIIIIMASPNIVNNITSSDDFTKIAEITADAEMTINESEAWATGEKGGVPVTEEAFSYTIDGNFTCTIDETVAKAKIVEVYGSSPGYLRHFTVTCRGVPEGETEIKWMITYKNNTILDIDLEEYGITVSGPLVQNNKILISLTESDIQYQNNAKYYAEQAASIGTTSVRYVEQTLTAAQKAQARVNIGAQESGDYQPAGDYINTPTSPVVDEFLQYASGGTWITTAIDAGMVGAIPSILTSYYYGTELPSDPIEGRLFFLRDADE